MIKVFMVNKMFFVILLLMDQKFLELIVGLFIQH